LRDVIDRIEALTGCPIERAYYEVIKCEVRRSAIEPVIGQVKTEGQIDCCYLKGRTATLPTSSSSPSATTSPYPRLAERSCCLILTAIIAATSAHQNRDRLVNERLITLTLPEICAGPALSKKHAVCRLLGDPRLKVVLPQANCATGFSALQNELEG
jgi:hypothetical protein